MSNEDLFLICFMWGAVSFGLWASLIESGSAKELGGRNTFWLGLFAPLVITFFIGWGLSRLLGYLFYLRKSL